MSEQQSRSSSENGEAWRSRPVMWNTRGGIAHVVIRATTRFGDVLQSFACGCVTSGFGLEMSTWYDARQRHRKICRTCIDRLQLAGARDEISPNA